MMLKLSSTALTIACVLLCACTGTAVRLTTPDAKALAQRLGQARIVTASLLVRIQPAQGDSELFTLRLWAAADGAVRLRAQKLDVDFLEALVRPDGGYQAVLVRERLATSGTLGGADDPALLRDLRLLLGELRYGPLPPAVAVAGDAAGWSWRDPLGWDAQLTIGSDGLPTSKRLLDAGVEVRALTYRRWQAFEELQRPSQVTLNADGDTTTIRIKSLDTPPEISAERMALRMPDGVEQVDPTAFNRRLLP